MSHWREVLFGIFLGLIVGALIYLVAATPRGTPFILKPLPTPEPLVIHIDGAVTNPGVYKLPEGSRVEDAVRAAGGIRADASTITINLAALLVDGQKIVIPDQNSPFISEPTIIPSKTSAKNGEKGRPFNLPLNINTASVTDFEKLPGIGEEKAANIIKFREEHGGFNSIDEILNVPGIGPGIYEKIMDLIVVPTSE